MASATTTLLGRIAHLPRPVRFGGVGGGCAVLQLGLLAGLVESGVDRHIANILAFIVSTQVHFFLSALVTWHDRGGLGHGWAGLSRRLALHNTMGLLSLMITQAVFIVTSHWIYYLLASALGIVASSCVNYRLSGRFTFAGAVGTRRGGP